MFATACDHHGRATVTGETVEGGVSTGFGGSVRISFGGEGQVCFGGRSRVLYGGGTKAEL